MQRHPSAEALMFAKFGKFIKQLNLYLNHFPKAERHALAGRIRKHSLYRFRRNLKAGRAQAIISTLGHAKGTASLPHLIAAIKETDHGKNLSLSSRFRRLHDL